MTKLDLGYRAIIEPAHTGPDSIGNFGTANIKEMVRECLHGKKRYGGPGENSERCWTEHYTDDRIAPEASIHNSPKYPPFPVV